jgi:putative transcriptional regulator
MARFKLDANSPPQLSTTQAAALDAMSDEAITAAALTDPDNPPLTDAELERLTAARRVREVRAHTGLSQASFAQTFHINVSRLRDLEQGRTQPDSAVLAYLAVID